MRCAWLLLLVGCGGPPFEVGSQQLYDVRPDAQAADSAPAADQDAMGEGSAPEDGGSAQDGRADAGEAQGDASIALQGCPDVVPPTIEVWEVSSDGGLAASPSNCQGSSMPQGDTYDCASITSNWVCPWQSTGQPSILLWCRKSGPIVIVGCQWP